MSAPAHQRGVTLIELVTSIAVVAIAVTFVLGTLTFASNRSADAVVRDQAIAIADSYLEEILLKGYTPDGKESSRAEYDDVDDYDALSEAGAHDQLGNEINELADYQVDVAVVTETLSGVTMKRVDVTVEAHGSVTRLSGYRASY